MTSKKYWLWGLVCAGILGLTACGESSSSSGLNPSKETTNIAGTLSLSGASNPEDYIVVVQNQDTKEIQHAEVSDDGMYSVEIAKSESENSDKVYVSMVNKETLTYAGPAVSGESVNNQKSSGLIVSGNVESLNLTYNTNLKSAEVSIPESEINISVDTTVKTTVTEDGVPVGVETFGKKINEGVSTNISANPVDRDLDGVPDIFDAVNDNEKLDNTNVANLTEAVLGIDAVASSGMFMNLKVDKEDVSEGGVVSVTENAVITIEVKAASGHDITGVKARFVHAHYNSATISPFPRGFTEVDTYPTTARTWLTGGNRPLYKATNPEGETIWTVFIKPGNNDFTVGDLILLEVTRSSGTEYIWTGINFKFTKVLNDEHTNYPLGGNGTRDNPYIIPDDVGDGSTPSGYVFSWEPPHDESDAELEDLEYSFEVFFFNAAHEQLLDLNLPVDETEGSIQVDTVRTTTERTIYKGDLSGSEINHFITESGGTNPAYMQVDIKGSYPYGDNSAMKIYIKRQGW